ncbi:MAG TPA: glycosyltransferase family 2 protein [Urbifossiella sp.]|jgi:glycosyltransferase involved in cell wall biosynthesis|nr:glycosyltransferase family 2 protein [Urbifossiella sp.]
MPSAISVIIPVYNGARFICDALTSVCTQTHPPVEVMVADDVSTDGTREVVAEFARTAPVPVTLFSMERNTGGPYGPASRAFGRTRGDYVCVLDADDEFAEDAFATYMAMFAADSGEAVGLATSDFLTFEDGTNRVVSPSFFASKADLLGRVLADPSPTGVLLDPDEALEMVSSAFVLPFKGMVSRAAWLELGGPNLALRHACDCDFIWRLLTRTTFRVRVLNRPLMRVRTWSGSMSANRLLESQELVRIFRQMLRDTGDPARRAVIRQRLDKELYDLAYISYKRRAFRTLLPAVCSLAAVRLRRTLRTAS